MLSEEDLKNEFMKEENDDFRDLKVKSVFYIKKNLKSYDIEKLKKLESHLKAIKESIESIKYDLEIETAFKNTEEPKPNKINNVAIVKSCCLDTINNRNNKQRG